MSLTHQPQKGASIATFCLLLFTFLATQLSFGQGSPTPQAVPLSADLKLPMTGDTPDQQLFFCTTRIEAVTADGKRRSVGTGFIISEKIDEQRQVLFVVTCRHVVDGFDKAALSFVAARDGKPDLGQRCEIVIGDLSKFVFFHADPKVDIALIPFVPVLQHFQKEKKTPFFRSLDRTLMPSPEQTDELSAIQPILFVGYPAGIRDEKNLLPMARRGFTATPYSVDYNGLPLFVIDATVYPGSSGSPVLVFDQGAFPTKGGGMAVGSRAHLLGLVSEGYFQEVEGEVQFRATPTAVSPIYKETRYLNLGIVVKARSIFETVDQFMKKFPPGK
jgi:hypothetical protein